MLFSKSNNFTVTPTILTFNGNNIEMVSSYRYLGVWLDTNLSFKCHVDNLTKKLRPKIGFLYSNRSCWVFFNSRKFLVQQLIMSIFDYCDVIYMHASATTLKPLDALYHIVHYDS